MRWLSRPRQPWRQHTAHGGPTVTDDDRDGLRLWGHGDEEWAQGNNTKTMKQCNVGIRIVANVVGQWWVASDCGQWAVWAVWGSVRV
eukprot:15465235-Alexandrium_andersonii.AAC.1